MKFNPKLHILYNENYILFLYFEYYKVLLIGIFSRFVFYLRCSF